MPNLPEPAGSDHHYNRSGLGAVAGFAVGTVGADVRSVYILVYGIRQVYEQLDQSSATRFAFGNRRYSASADVNSQRPSLLGLQSPRQGPTT